MALRDVKNEGTSGDVYENTGKVTICRAMVRPFCRKFRGFDDKLQESIRIAGRQCTSYAEIRGESAPTVRALPEHFTVIGGLGHEP